MNTELKEDLLSAWMDMELNIRGNRLVQSLSFNEIIICNILHRSKNHLTATDLQNSTKLLKSQINKTLTLMEKKELISRVRCASDKRKIFITLRSDKLEIYLNEHENVMKIVGHICDTLGEEKAKQMTLLMHETVKAVQTLNIKN